MSRRAWLGATILSLLAVSWAASCGGDDSGSGGTASGTASSGSGGSAGSVSSGGSGGIGGDTSGGGKEACDVGDDPCGLCAYAACPETYCDCDADVICSDLAVCQVGCGADDPACVQDCWTSYSGGIAAGALLYQCSAVSCSSECGDIQPFGPCEVCLFESCPDAMNNCLGNPECAGLIGCVVECAGDQTCATQCYFDFSGGITDATPVGQCAANTCGGDCQF